MASPGFLWSDFDRLIKGFSTGDSKSFQPIGSMYGIFTYIYHKFMPNVGKYAIHGSYGQVFRIDSDSQKTIPIELWCHLGDDWMLSLENSLRGDRISRGGMEICGALGLLEIFLKLSLKCLIMFHSNTPSVEMRCWRQGGGFVEEKTYRCRRSSKLVEYSVQPQCHICLMSSDLRMVSKFWDTNSKILLFLILCSCLCVVEVIR